MIKIFLVMGFVLSGTAFSAEQQYKRAVDMHPGDVVRVARFARSMYEMGEIAKEEDGVRDLRDVTIGRQRLASVVKEDGTVHVVLNSGALSRFTPSGGGDNVINFAGGVANARLSLLAGALMQPTLELLRGGVFNYENDAIIVSGAGDSGAVASLLSVGIKQSYRGGQTLRRNQIKVIMFNPPSAGDAELVATVHREVGVANILNFRCSAPFFGRFYDRLRGHEVCGVPLRISLSRQLAGSCESGSRRCLSAGLTVLGYGLMAYSVYSYPTYSSGLSLDRLPLFESLASIPLTSMPPSTREELRGESLGMAFATEISRVCGDSRRASLKFFLVGSLCLLVDRLLSCKVLPPVPSDYVVRESLLQAQRVLSTKGIEGLL
jgi:hypothetical protein